MFSMSLTLKEYFPLYFWSVSIVLLTPIKIKLIDFLKNNVRKSYDTASGADLNNN